MLPPSSIEGEKAACSEPTTTIHFCLTKCQTETTIILFAGGHSSHWSLSKPYSSKDGVHTSSSMSPPYDWLRRQELIGCALLHTSLQTTHMHSIAPYGAVEKQPPQTWIVIIHVCKWPRHSMQLHKSEGIKITVIHSRCCDAWLLFQISWWYDLTLVGALESGGTFLCGKPLYRQLSEVTATEKSKSSASDYSNFLSM